MKMLRYIVIGAVLALVAAYLFVVSPVTKQNAAVINHSIADDTIDNQNNTTGGCWKVKVTPKEQTSCPDDGAQKSNITSYTTGFTLNGFGLSKATDVTYTVYKYFCESGNAQNCTQYGGSTTGTVNVPANGDTNIGPFTTSASDFGFNACGTYQTDVHISYKDPASQATCEWNNNGVNGGHTNYWYISAGWCATNVTCVKPKTHMECDYQLQQCVKKDGDGPQSCNSDCKVVTPTPVAYCSPTTQTMQLNPTQTGTATVGVVTDKIAAGKQVNACVATDGGANSFVDSVTGTSNNKNVSFPVQASHTYNVSLFYKDSGDNTCGGPQFTGSNTTCGVTTTSFCPTHTADYCDDNNHSFTQTYDCNQNPFGNPVDHGFDSKCTSPTLTPTPPTNNSNGCGGNTTQTGTNNNANSNCQGQTQEQAQGQAQGQAQTQSQDDHSDRHVDVHVDVNPTMNNSNTNTITIASYAPPATQQQIQVAPAPNVTTLPKTGGEGLAFLALGPIGYFVRKFANLG